MRNTAANRPVTARAVPPTYTGGITPVIPAKKKRRVPVPVVIIILLLVVGGIGAAAWAFVIQPNQQTAPVAATSSDAYWVLVVGNDTRIGTVEIDKPQYADGNKRSDTIMLVRVDPKTYHLAVITVPRDTQIDLNGAPNKLNESYAEGGITALKSEIAKLTGITPKYYLDTTFVDFEQLVNTLGGVNAEVPINMTLQDIVGGEQVTLAPGPQDLDGASALVLARSRKQYADDLDACRQIQDRQLLQNMITKLAADPATVTGVSTAMLGNIETDWDQADLLATAADFAAHSDKITFASGTGPYAGGIPDGSELWLATRDEETWKRVIAAAESGSDPTSVVPLPAVAAAA